MYGQKSQLLVNLYFGTQKACGNATSTKFVQQLCERLKWAYKTAKHVIEKENKRPTWNYDNKIRCTHLAMGDMVFFKRTDFKGKHKIQD